MIFNWPKEFTLRSKLFFLMYQAFIFQGHPIINELLVGLQKLPFMPPQGKLRILKVKAVTSLVT